MMNTKKMIFIGMACCATLPGLADSLLQATKFPKTFADVDFADRMAVLAEGYGVFDVVYDENGNCVSGCAYSGLTFQQDQENTDQATEYFEDLVAQAISEEENTEASGVKIPSDKKIKSVPMRSPLKNSEQIQITSDFGFREYQGGKYFHTGIDIKTNAGTPIYATADGTVSRVVQDTTGAAGKYIEIKHAHGLYSQYMHLNTTHVAIGDTVRAGDLIGLSGCTGKCFGNHLHYQIYWDKGGEKAYIDILCPCASSYKRNNKSKSYTNINTSQYTCGHSALNHSYCFSGNEKENRVDWRIKSRHCMDGSSRTQKLPDETGKCK